MDINKQLEGIVSAMIADIRVQIETDVKATVNQTVTNKIASSELQTLVDKAVKDHITRKVEAFNFEDVSKKNLQKIVENLTEQINTNLVASINTQVTDGIEKRLQSIDIRSVATDIVKDQLGKIVEARQFKDRSISHTAINFANLVLSGDHIKGGIIENFGSTGIEDLATHVQMTLMDHAVAFEGPVYAPEAQIKGNVKIEGDLIITGSVDASQRGFDNIVYRARDEVRASLNQELFNTFSDTVFQRIAREGLDLDRITQNSKEVVKGNQLGYHITQSNLTKLGLVADLQTTGENLLVNTLYISKGRVGVNTMDPGSAFVVVDGEVEVNVYKHSANTAYIGTPRRQDVILGSNLKKNIVLDQDGNVTIQQLTIGTSKHSSGAKVPNHAGNKGDIVWNTEPAVGSAIGWVCLGSTRWAKFGTIE